MTRSQVTSHTCNAYKRQVASGKSHATRVVSSLDVWDEALAELEELSQTNLGPQALHF